MYTLKRKWYFIYTSWTSISSYSFICFINELFWYVIRFCFIHLISPVISYGWLNHKTEWYSPLAPIPLQNIHSYYEMFRPYTLHLYFYTGKVFTHCFSLIIKVVGSTIPYKSLYYVHATFTPVTVQSVSRSLLNSSYT